MPVRTGNLQSAAALKSRPPATAPIRMACLYSGTPVSDALVQACKLKPFHPSRHTALDLLDMVQGFRDGGLSG